MNNKIKNPKTEVPETLEMNDKDYITTMLTIEKGMVKDYAVALTEASNTELFNDYNDMFNEITKLQREIYNLMFKIIPAIFINSISKIGSRMIPISITPSFIWL